VNPPVMATAGARRRHRAALPACALAALAVLAGGCATVPTTGQALPITEPSDTTNQGADFPQLIPAPPGKGWSPRQIVSGFLAASASFAGNHSVARQYLVAKQARSWNPGWAVTVVTAQPRVSHGKEPLRVTGQRVPSNSTNFTVSGLELAALNTSGQFEAPRSPSRRTKVPFNLVKVHGQWRITNPPRKLLLSNAEFHRVYQPRDLYYFATGSDTLVPDPVFVPLQATATDLATGLVTALRQQPADWLAIATETRFPARTKLAAPVRIEGTAAIVNLGGAVATADTGTLDAMAAQLVWTLTSPSYGPSGLTSVRFEVNGQPAGVNASGVEVRSTYRTNVPATSSAAALYFVGRSGGVQMLPVTGTAKPAAVPGEAGTGEVAMNPIAIAPSLLPKQPPRYIAGVSPSRRTVYIGAMTKGAVLRSWRPGGAVSSLSWDPEGELWVATSNGLWVAGPGSQAPVAVDFTLAPGDRVTALRVAPDGVRLAMIVQSGKTSQVMVGAIARTNGKPSIGVPVAIGAGVTDPTALSWYDADDLAVLSQAGTVGATIKQVPVNGGQSANIGSEQRAISLATAGSQIVAGLPGTRLVTSTPSTDDWKLLPPGQNPVYPG
jgi:spore germination protein GerM